MHFVAALDDVPEMRGVLGLFEGVATGAADGYARMADRPAATLLHLGPGLGNGSPTCTTPAGRARRSSTSSATTPRTTSSTTRRSSPTSRRVAAQRVAAGSAGRRRPSDVGARRGRRRGRGDRAARAGRDADPARRRVVGRGRRRRRAPRRRRARAAVADDVVERGGQGAARRASRACSCSAARRCREAGLRRRQPRSRRPPAPSCSCETFPARLERGAGRARRSSASATSPSSPSRSSTALRHLVLVDAKAPVSFFAYPDKASDLVPDGCEVHVLAGRRRRRRRRARPPRRRASARRRRRRCSARAAGPTARPARSPPRRSPHALGALLPEGAIVVRRGATPSGLFAPGATAGAPPPRLAARSPAAPSAGPARWPRARRSRAPTAR